MIQRISYIQHIKRNTGINLWGNEKNILHVFHIADPEIIENFYRISTSIFLARYEIIQTDLVWTRYVRH